MCTEMGAIPCTVSRILRQCVLVLMGYKFHALDYMYILCLYFAAKIRVETVLLLINEGFFLIKGSLVFNNLYGYFISLSTHNSQQYLLCINAVY